MPKYVIEREVPGAGKMSDAELRTMAQNSNRVLRDMGPKIQWVESFVTDDRIYCVYVAQEEKTILEHANRGGFPANRVSAVRRIIDPTTGE